MGKLCWECKKPQSSKKNDSSRPPPSLELPWGARPTVPCQLELGPVLQMGSPQCRAEQGAPPSPCWPCSVQCPTGNHWPSWPLGLACGQPLANCWPTISQPGHHWSSRPLGHAASSRSPCLSTLGQRELHWPSWLPGQTAHSWSPCWPARTPRSFSAELLSCSSALGPHWYVQLFLLRCRALHWHREDESPHAQAYLMGTVSSFLLCLSRGGTTSHPKVRLQSKLPRLCCLPYCTGLENSKVLRSMVVMSGLTTAVGSSAMRDRRGSNHPWKHSPGAQGRVNRPHRHRFNGMRQEWGLHPNPRGTQRVVGRWTLTVCIQEGEHLAARHAGSQQPGRDQPLPLRLPHHPHNLQLLHVAVQLVLQIFWGNRRGWTASG